MKGWHFIFLTPDAPGSTNFALRVQGTILDEIRDGALLCRFHMGPRTHNRLVPVAEAMQWTLFETPAELNTFMESMQPPKQKPTPVPADMVDLDKLLDEDSNVETSSK